MYIPSKSISYLIESEQFGIWSEVYSDGKKVALIIKATSAIIKSVVQGCKVELYVGVNEGIKNHCAIALKIFDSIESPILIPMTPRSQREADGIVGLVKKLAFSFAMYNEVNMPSLSGEGILNASSEGFPEIFFSEYYSVADNLYELNQLVDSFCFSIDPDYGTQNFHNFSIRCFNMNLKNLKSMAVISENELGAIYNKIDISDEGLSQELQLSQFLENIHNNNVYHSPKVKAGRKERELIDILSFDVNCNFLIESKALCLNDSGFRISDNRKSSTLAKGSKKALNQLEGAAKVIKRGENIITKDGAVIHISKEKEIHGIAIVSDLPAKDTWQDIISMIKRKSKKGFYLHVIEYHEFIKTIKISFSETVSFEQCLLQRYNAVLEHETLNIKGMDSSLPFYNDN